MFLHSDFNDNYFEVLHAHQELAHAVMDFMAKVDFSSLKDEHVLISIFISIKSSPFISLGEVFKYCNIIDYLITALRTKKQDPLHVAVDYYNMRETLLDAYGAIMKDFTEEFYVNFINNLFHNLISLADMNVKNFMSVCSEIKRPEDRELGEEIEVYLDQSISAKNKWLHYTDLFALDDINEIKQEYFKVLENDEHPDMVINQIVNDLMNINDLDGLENYIILSMKLNDAKRLKQITKTLNDYKRVFSKMERAGLFNSENEECPFNYELGEKYVFYNPEGFLNYKFIACSLIEHIQGCEGLLHALAKN